MKKQMKKGFTIVELVVVVAVIAILSAVLIPTFSGIIEKANLSSDQRAVQQMNTAIAMAEEKVTSLEDAVNALEKAGYAVKNLKPLTKHREFLWNKDLNAVVLVKTDEATGQKTVEFPTEAKYSETFEEDLAAGDVLFNLCDGAKYIDVVAADADDLRDAILAGTKNISLKKNLTIKNESITLPDNADIVLDLNGHKLTANYQRPFVMSDGSKLTINAKDSIVDCTEFGLVNVPQNTTDVEIVINDGTFNASLDNGSFIRLRANNKDVKITLNNVTYVENNSPALDSNGDPNRCYVLNTAGFSGNMTLDVIGGSYTADFGFQVPENTTATFTNAKFNTKGYAIYCEGTSTATGCDFTIGTKVDDGGCPAAALAVGIGGTGEIKNSTINLPAATGEQYAYAVCTTGGKITATNNKITATNNTNDPYRVYDLDLTNAVADGVIIIDGVVKDEKTR